MTGRETLRRACVTALGPAAPDAVLDYIQELEGSLLEVERARAALRDIADMTDPDDGFSYRADDREGCLDTVFETAKRALAATDPRVEGGGA